MGAPTQMTEIKRSIMAEKIELAELSFTSKETFHAEIELYRGPGITDIKDVEFKVKISFIPTGDDRDYTYNDEIGGLDYAVALEAIPVGGDPDVRGVDIEYWFYDSFFYAKKITENKFVLFDCDSTANCYDNYNDSVFYVFNTPHGKVLKMKKKEFGMVNLHGKVFHEDK